VCDFFIKDCVLVLIFFLNDKNQTYISEFETKLIKKSIIIKMFILFFNFDKVAIYENALKVGEKTQTDFMLYPSGMLVARPAADGSGGITYTKILS
jgi:hypothetical protein